MTRLTLAAIAIVGLVAATPATAATTATAPYDDGAVALTTPKGWTVKVERPGNATVVILSQDPQRSDAAGIILMLGPYQAGSTGESVMKTGLDSLGFPVTVVQKQSQAMGAGQQLIGTFAQNGKQGALAAVAMVSPQTNQTMFAVFACKQADFQRLGGMQLLHTVAFSLRPSRPAAAGGPSPGPPRATGAPTLTPLAANSLPGSWSKVGIGALMERVDLYGEHLGYDSHGSGTMYVFHKNRRYELIYRADQTSGMCRSEAKITETGKYTIEGQTLTLRPRTHSGTICLCCAGNKTKINKRNGAPRRYQVGAVQGRSDAIVLRGHCAPFMVDSNCSSVENLGSGKAPDLSVDFALKREK